MTVARILDEKGRDVFTTQPHRTLKEVIELLAEKGVGAVVVSDASLSVLGIVSERDIVRVLAKHGASALDDPVSRYMTSKVITASAPHASKRHATYLVVIGSRGCVRRSLRA